MSRRPPAEGAFWQPARCPKCKAQDAWQFKGMSGWMICTRCYKVVTPERWIEIMKKAAKEAGCDWF